MTQEIYVGKRPLKVYLSKALNVLESEDEVTLSARGALISRAVVIANRLTNSVSDLDTKLGIVMATNKSQREVDIPTITIRVPKGKVSITLDVDTPEELEKFADGLAEPVSVQARSPRPTRLYGTYNTQGDI